MKRLKIKAHSISFKDGRKITIKRGKARATRGKFHYNTNSIEISSDVDEDEIRSTLLHEMCHAILAPLDLNPVLEEEIVAKLEDELWPLLKGEYFKKVEIS